MITVCPHCEFEFEIEDAEIEYMHKNGYINDFECPECGELMDIYVELKWTGKTSIIERDVCDECLGSFRTRDLHYSNKCSPWPMKEGLHKLCPECFRKVLYGEIDARQEYLAKLTDENKKNIKKTYQKGMRIHVNQVKDPYYIRRYSNIDVTIDSVKDGCIVMCSLINGELVKLYPGFDDFHIKEEL